MNKRSSRKDNPSDDTGMTEEEKQRLREEGETSASDEESMWTDEY